MLNMRVGRFADVDADVFGLSHYLMVTKCLRTVGRNAHKKERKHMKPTPQAQNINQTGIRDNPPENTARLYCCCGSARQLGTKVSNCDDARHMSKATFPAGKAAPRRLKLQPPTRKGNPA